MLVEVNDPLLGGLVCANPPEQDPLQPGQAFTCQASTLISTDTLNVATSMGIPVDGEGQPIPGAVASDITWASVEVEGTAQVGYEVYLPLFGL